MQTTIEIIVEDAVKFTYPNTLIVTGDCWPIGNAMQILSHPPPQTWNYSRWRAPILSKGFLFWIWASSITPSNRGSHTWQTSEASWMAGVPGGWTSGTIWRVSLKVLDDLGLVSWLGPHGRDTGRRGFKMVTYTPINSSWSRKLVASKLELFARVGQLELTRRW